jgi:glycosyltransferase involved in cell wall biosynthesis
MSSRAPILWLASWYPNRLDPFTGDFIQRHARAVAEKEKLYVIFLRRDTSIPSGTLQIDTRTSGLLTEVTGYYNSRGKWLSLIHYLAFYRKLIRTFFVTHGRPALVHVHVGLRAGIMALWMKKQFRIPYVVTEHWTGYNPDAEPSIYNQGRLARWIAAAVFRQASLVMPVSEDLGNHIRRIEPAVKISVINNVVDTRLFYFQPKNRVSPYTFVHASSLSAQKNPELLLTAFQALRHKENWRLVVAGPVTADLKEMAARLQINDRINWLGEISYADVAFAMRGADCFVLSSNFENSPCVIGEALCCGVPVVSTKVGGIAELVNETCGLLVPPNDSQALQNALLHVYTADASWNREEIAKSAVLKFSYKEIALEIVTRYKTVLENEQKR